MKKLFMPAFLLAALFLLNNTNVDAQRGRGGFSRYRSAPILRVRPRISFGIGGYWGGVYGYYPGYYGWGPRVGVNVVIPPPGAHVGDLPPGTVERVYGGITYYYRSNTYYIQTEDGGYQIVPPPLGASVDRLPIGARLRKIDGNYYYERNGTFYQMQKDNNGRNEYIIVGEKGRLDLDAANENRNNDNSTEDSENLMPPENDDAPIVRNGNALGDENGGDADRPTGSSTNSVWPQVGDRFDQLPRNSRSVTVNGSRQFVSPNGIYYKEIKEDGNTVYEVVKTK